MKQQRNSEMSFAIQVIAFLFLTGRVSSWEMQNLPIDLLPQVDPDFAPVHWHSHSDKSVSNMENKVFQSKAEQESIPSFAAKFVCPFHYGDFPDPEDCSSYYKCLNKNPKKKKCPKNQNFDKISKKCVSKSNAVCADKDYNKEHENIDFKCPYNYGRYPNKKDCSKFYLCLHNKPALMYCPPDELYDIKRKKCFNKSKVKCEGRFNPYEKTTTMITRPPTRKPKPTITKKFKSTTKSVSIIQSTSTSHHSETPSVTYDQVITTTIIPSVTSVEDVDETSSTKDAEIISETSTLTKDLVTLTDKPESSTSHDESTSSITKEPFSTTLEETTNVSQVSTNDISPESTSAPESSTQWTIPSSDSTLSQLVTDKIKEFVCSERKGKFPYTEDCSKYYNCKKFEAKLEECGIGTLFDEKQGFCYNEKDVDCGNRKRPDGEVSTVESDTTSTKVELDATSTTVELDATSTTVELEESSTTVELEATSTTVELEATSTTVMSRETSYISQSTATPSTSSTSSSSSTSETTHSELVTKETKEFVCPERKGKFPYPEDCSKYYNCKKFEAKLEDCGLGTLFDEKRGFCYSGKDVDCSSRKRPEQRVYQVL